MVHVTFWEAGALGMDLYWPVVEGIQPGTPAAAAAPLLRAGLLVVAVQGQDVQGLTSRDGGQLFRAAKRPTRLTFRLPTEVEEAERLARSAGGSDEGILAPQPEPEPEPAAKAGSSDLLVEAPTAEKAQGLQDGKARVCGGARTSRCENCAQLISAITGPKASVGGPIVPLELWLSMKYCPACAEANTRCGPDGARCSPIWPWCLGERFCGVCRFVGESPGPCSPVHRGPS
jgi:hypothetical protein